MKHHNGDKEISDEIYYSLMSYFGGSEWVGYSKKDLREKVFYDRLLHVRGIGIKKAERIMNWLHDDNYKFPKEKRKSIIFEILDYKIKITITIKSRENNAIPRFNTPPPPSSKK